MALIVIIVVVAGVAFYALSAGASSDGGGGGGNCGSISASQVASYAQNAGFSGSDLVMAVAVSLAENNSSDPCVTGDKNITPGGSVGLWQINLKAHPDLAMQDLTNPQTNANAAFAIYTAAGNSFAPWTTYQNGISGTLLNEASNGVTQMQGGG